MASLKRILCIDDDPDIRRVLELTLRMTLKAEVACAASAVDALSWLAAHPVPEVILLDAMMPQVDGYMLCERLRADERYRKVPIVFLTAKARPAERERALRAGANACLAKPFNPMSLGASLRAVLKQPAPEGAL